MTVDELIQAGVEWHTDAGHAWLRVPLAAARRIDSICGISRYSYMDEEWAYLEEDVDATSYLKLNGFEPGTVGRLKDINDGDYSPIRQKARFR